MLRSPIVEAEANEVGHEDEVEWRALANAGATWSTGVENKSNPGGTSLHGRRRVSSGLGADAGLGGSGAGGVPATGMPRGHVETYQSPTQTVTDAVFARYSSCLGDGVEVCECTSSVRGSCTTFTCAEQSSPRRSLWPNAPEAGEVREALLSAGVVTVAGGAGSALELAPNGAYQYHADEDRRRWEPGDVIAISASGADIPASTGQVTLPASITVTEPDLSAMPLTLRIDQAFNVRWQGAGSRRRRGTVRARFVPDSYSYTNDDSLHGAHRCGAARGASRARLQSIPALKAWG